MTTPYKDVHGNPVRMTKVVVKSPTTSNRLSPGHPPTPWRKLRWLSVMATFVVVAAILGLSPVMAAGSVRSPGTMGPAPRTIGASQMTLAQAPAELKLAARSARNSPAQKAKLTASDGAVNNLFGYSVAISGSTAVVGAGGKNLASGAAYVFVRSGANWTQQKELTASDHAANDYFGYAVAISGSTVVVGAYGKNGYTGAAYVFVRSGTLWSQQAELSASGRAVNDEFGWSVAISGSTAVIGAQGNNSNTGAAYIFGRLGTVWTQQAKITASDAAGRDEFGWSVAISGSTAVVGKNSASGAAYVFVRSGTIWSQQAKLIASDGAAGDNFGYSVAVSNSTAMVGAPAKNSCVGAAYVFARSGTTWTQQAELTAADGAACDYFGNSAAISGSTAVIGAHAKKMSTGAAYVFVRSPSKWTQKAELIASDGVAADNFGLSVAVSGSSVVVGAPYKNSQTGAAYVFVLPT